MFFERYDGFREYPEILLDGLTEEQIRTSPHPAANPIVWILWHTARCEDVGVNRLAADRPQVLDDGGWFDRLGTQHRHIGTGMTRQEVTELSERVRLPDLIAYRTSITTRTTEIVNSLSITELDQKLKEDRLRQVFEKERAGGSVSDALVQAYAGQTKGWLLGHIALTHNFYHIGQAFVLRGVHGLPNPW